MIASKDRSGWFGASDVNYIVGNYSTKSFKNWWLEKAGYTSNNFSNESMKAGTYYEHAILDFIDVKEKDKQIKIPSLLLRVNLDGSDETTIYEVKTYKYENGFKVPLRYKRQVWVQLYSTNLKTAYIVSYGLIKEDYKNYFNDIDKERLERHLIEPNDAFIKNEFLPCLKYLCFCLAKGIFPTNEGRSKWINSNAM